MAVKRYNLLNIFRLETSVTVNQEQVRVSFSGGSKFREVRNGYYLTADKAVQEALESDTSYGSLWLCVTPDEEDIPIVAQEEPQHAPQSEKQQEEHPVEKISNYTEAKIMVISLYPETTRLQIISAEKLRSYAKEKGLVFPNWKE